MLDTQLQEQLRTVFAELQSNLTLSVAPSPHPQHQELLELLGDVATCSHKIIVEQSGESTPAPQFDLLKDGVFTGIRFRGIPGGHEFTSLVLAVLNADGKGKQPDAGIAQRVRNLRGPISVRTYISLSCTNCPDVVQALNLMALLHPDFTHTMIDGAMAEAEVANLGVQAVPSVFDGNNALVHVGKADFSGLLETLENHYGSAPAAVADAPTSHFDVVVIGGGPAGASAAIYSARKGLRTAVIAQKLGGQVQETKGIENLISVIYTEGPRLAADLEKHMREYGITLLEHRQVESVSNGSPKTVHLKGGERVEASSLIIATGAKWRELGVPGEKEYLGRGVAFCPHCDGPFYKGKRVAVVGGGNSGIEAAIDLAGICSHVTVLEFADSLKADAVLVKAAQALPNVVVLTHVRSTEVVGNGQTVTELKYQDRGTEQEHSLELDGIFVQIGLAPNSAVVKDLVEINRFGEIVIDPKCRTSVPGIYAAGDVTTVPFKQIVISMGEGAKAALTAFEDRIRS